MPYNFGWLTGVDRVLLEWLSENDIVFSPSILDANLRRELPETEAPGYSQVSRRTRALYNAGFLDTFGETQGKYVLSDRGRRFIEEELTDEERRELAELEPEESISNE